jgi:hypothetical protein
VYWNGLQCLVEVVQGGVGQPYTRRRRMKTSLDNNNKTICTCVENVLYRRIGKFNQGTSSEEYSSKKKG